MDDASSEKQEEWQLRRFFYKKFRYLFDPKALEVVARRKGGAVSAEK